MNKLPKVLITGASAGIGATYADRFAKRGHDLVLVSNEPEQLAYVGNQLAAREGIKVECINADLTNDSDLVKIEAKLKADEEIGILVNNAGMSLPGVTIQNSREKLAKIISLNANQVALLSAAAASSFAGRGSGAIINIASVLGLAAVPQIAPAIYSATKAFVITLSQSLRVELAESGVYVQCVLPAATRTEIWQKSGMNPKEIPGMIDARDLVDAALVGFDREEAITIPTLVDEHAWDAYDAARAAVLPPSLGGAVANRYRVANLLAD